MTSFTDLGVPARLTDVLRGLGFDTPTPIQQAALPDAFAGRDLLGRGRTGSGKTLAFLLPLVARLTGSKRTRPGAPRAMILAPTRELVAQIDTALQPLAKAARLTSRTVFGGVGQGAQVAAIRRGADIIVACPGRLEDLIEQGHCSLADIEISVLDEADHMADLGFLPAVRRILARTPAGGQRMLFSATLDRAVDALVKQFLVKPRVHQADSAQSPVTTMSHHVLQIARENRLPILVDLTSAPGRTVVFTRTKHGARGLARQLNRNGVPAVELHGNLNQNARTRNLDAFHSGRASTLVATDIAARGIHVDDVALVIHADPPVDPKAYLHRSGRTARAGNSGSVITLATSDQAQEVKQLTRAAGITPQTTRIDSADHAVLGELAPGPRIRIEPVAPAAAPEPAGSGRGGRRQGQRRNGGTGPQAAGSASRPAASSPERSRTDERVDTEGRSGTAGRSGTEGRSRGRRRGAGRGRGKPAATATDVATAEGKTKPGNRPAPSRSRRRSRSSSASAPSHSAAAFSAGRR